MMPLWIGAVMCMEIWGCEFRVPGFEFPGSQRCAEKAEMHRVFIIIEISNDNFNFLTISISSQHFEVEIS